MKSYGFSMIELIFVIVILGISATVAIPKLSNNNNNNTNDNKNIYNKVIFINGGSAEN